MKSKKGIQKQTGVISAVDMRQKKYKIMYAFLFAFMMILALSVIIPTVWIFLTGFKGSQEIYEIPARFFPKEFHLSRIGEAWKEIDISGNILATFILAFGEMAGMLLVCGFGGYVMSRLRPKGVKAVFVLVVLTMMMPSTVRIVPLYMSFVDFPIGHFSMLNTYWPMIMIASANAFNLVLFKNFFDSISMSIVESARMDGCGDIRVFFHIMVPLSTPVIVYTALRSFNAVWSDFLMPMLVLSDQKLQPVPTVIFRLKSTALVRINNYMMSLCIACVPPILIFIFFQKKIMGGINVGAVKG